MKKMISKIKWSLLGVILPAITLAAAPTTVTTTGATDFKATIEGLVSWAVGIAGLIAVVFIVVGGIMIITSGGEEEKTKKGKGYVTYGIIGLVVVIVAGALVNYVISTVK